MLNIAYLTNKYRLRFPAQIGKKNLAKIVDTWFNSNLLTYTMTI